MGDLIREFVFHDNFGTIDLGGKYGVKSVAPTRAVAKPGDAIAVESPTFFGVLQTIETLGMKAVEVGTYPREGMCLDELSAAIRRHKIAAVILTPSFQNPLGALMPLAKKKALVALLARHGIPLVEDDVYGELHGGAHRPLPAKAFDQAGLVLHCSSFSKCLAPGYRVGWAAAGRYTAQVQRLKMMSTLATSRRAGARTPATNAVA